MAVNDKKNFIQTYVAPPGLSYPETEEDWKPARWGVAEGWWNSHGSKKVSNEEVSASRSCNK